MIHIGIFAIQFKDRVSGTNAHLVGGTSGGDLLDQHRIDRFHLQRRSLGFRHLEDLNSQLTARPIFIDSDRNDRVRYVDRPCAQLDLRRRERLLQRCDLRFQFLHP